MSTVRLAAWAIGLVLLTAPAVARDFDHAAICHAIDKGTAIHLHYKPGEGVRGAMPEFG